MYRINLAISESLQKKHVDAIQIKRCYENVFNLITSISHAKGSKSVLFCYLQTEHSKPTYIRHAFLLLDGEIIEPLPSIRESAVWDSIVEIACLSFEKYLDLLLLCKRYDCWPALKREELKALEGSKIIINPFELSDFVMLFAKDSKAFLELAANASQGQYSAFWPYID